LPASVFTSPLVRSRSRSSCTVNPPSYRSTLAQRNARAPPTSLRGSRGRMTSDRSGSVPVGSRLRHLARRRRCGRLR
jgi:hypothetical protein